jgi:hypothetical protein
MRKLIAIGMATVLLLALMIAIVPVQASGEPPPDTPGVWIVYPGSTPDHWVGNDRHSDIWGPDLHTSIHEALGYSGQLLYPGSNNWDIGYWEFYNPPPEGSIIELRGPGLWDIGGDGAQGGAGREKMKSLVVQQNGITIRGQDYDDGTGNMMQQEILFNNGATTALFYLEASDLTIENVHIRGTWPTSSGGYALAIGRYTMIGPDPNATGLTIKDCNFNNLRGMFDQQPTVADLTVVANTVTSTSYNIFKSGVTFTGDSTITANTFNGVAEVRPIPALQVLGHTGTTSIDYNTFNGWRSGQYAIKVDSALASPIGIGDNNVFEDQVGGSGAGYELYPLTSGGYAVGAPSADDITACAAADDEGPITTNVAAVPNPVKVGESVAVTANVDDTTTGGSNIASAEYSLDGGAWTAMDAQDGGFDAVSEDVTATFTAPATAGIYDLCVRGTDEHANIGDSECIMLVIYDPEGGFVTGGGWIMSPEGAYTADPTLTGKANLGFVSKYKKGASVPEGNTEFQFKAGNLNFHSSAYNWLMVTGSNYARFKGEGAINDEGSYKFMLWASDGAPDPFRIKIWGEDEAGDETVVYDNGMDQAIGGGSIVIHTK